MSALHVALAVAAHVALWRGLVRPSFAEHGPGPDVATALAAAILIASVAGSVSAIVAGRAAWSPARALSWDGASFAVAAWGIVVLSLGPWTRDLAGVVAVAIVAGRLAPGALAIVSGRAPPWLSLVVAAGGYVALAMWLPVASLPFGDQVHYLLVADRLAHGSVATPSDPRLFTELLGFAPSAADDATHVALTPLGPRPVQGYALALAILPGWVLGGRAGAEVVLALIGAWTSFVTLLILRDVWPRDPRDPRDVGGALPPLQPPRTAGPSGAVAPSRAAPPEGGGPIGEFGSPPLWERAVGVTWLMATALLPMTLLATHVYPNMLGAAVIGTAFRWGFTARADSAPAGSADRRAGNDPRGGDADARRPALAAAVLALTLFLTPRDAVALVVLLPFLLGERGRPPLPPVRASAVRARVAIASGAVLLLVIAVNAVLYGLPVPYASYAFGTAQAQELTRQGSITALVWVTLPAILFDRTLGIAGTAPWLFIGLLGLLPALAAESARMRSAVERAGVRSDAQRLETRSDIWPGTPSPAAHPVLLPAALAVGLSVVALSFFRLWEGGYAPPARYFVDVLPLWMPFVAYGLAWAFQEATEVSDASRSAVQPSGGAAQRIRSAIRGQSLMRAFVALLLAVSALMALILNGVPALALNSAFDDKIRDAIARVLGIDPLGWLPSFQPLTPDWYVAAYLRLIPALAVVGALVVAGTGYGPLRKAAARRWRTGDQLSGDRSDAAAPRPPDVAVVTGAGRADPDSPPSVRVFRQQDIAERQRDIAERQRDVAEWQQNVAKTRAGQKEGPSGTSSEAMSVLGFLRRIRVFRQQDVAERQRDIAEQQREVAEWQQNVAKTRAGQEGEGRGGTSSEVMHVFPYQIGPTSDQFGTKTHADLEETPAGDQVRALLQSGQAEAEGHAELPDVGRDGRAPKVVGARASSGQVGVSLRGAGDDISQSTQAIGTALFLVVNLFATALVVIATQQSWVALGPDPVPDSLYRKWLPLSLAFAAIGTAVVARVLAPAERAVLFRRHYLLYLVPLALMLIARFGEGVVVNGALGAVYLLLAVGFALNALAALRPAVGRVSDRATALQLATVALVVAVVLLPYHRAVMPTASDEPHYLLVTQSLLYDHDLDLANDYAGDRYSAFYPSRLPDIHGVKVGAAVYSIRDLGMPILAVVPYALAGRLGVLALLCLVGALLAAQLYLLARDLGFGARVAFLATATAALSHPLFTYTTQIYPELLTALAFVTAARLMRAGARATTRDLLLASALLGALPWLSTRAWPIVIGAGLVLAWIALRPAWGRPRELAPRLAAAAIPFAALVLALAYLNWRTFGLFLPSAGYFLIREQQPVLTLTPWIGAPGLLFDRVFGLIPRAPVYLLAFVGAVPLIRHRRGHEAELAAIALGSILAFAYIADIAYWWADGSPPSRYALESLPLLVLAVAGGWEVLLSDALPRAWRLPARGTAALLVAASGLVAYVYGALPNIRYDLALDVAATGSSGGLFAFVDRAAGVDVGRVFPSLVHVDALSAILVLAWLGASAGLVAIGRRSG